MKKKYTERYPLKAISPRTLNDKGVHESEHYERKVSEEEKNISNNNSSPLSDLRSKYNSETLKLLAKIQPYINTHIINLFETLNSLLPYEVETWKALIKAFQNCAESNTIVSNDTIKNIVGYADKQLADLFNFINTIHNPNNAAKALKIFPIDGITQAILKECFKIEVEHYYDSCSRELQAINKTLTAAEIRGRKHGRVKFYSSIESQDNYVKIGLFEDAVILAPYLGDNLNICTEEYYKVISIQYNNKGYEWYNLEQYQHALQSYSKAIDYCPYDNNYYNNRGNSYFNLEKYQESIRDYSNAIELNPKNALYYNHRGNSYFNLEKYQEAILDYSRAIELNPKNSVYYNHRGNSYFNLEKYQEAILDYSRAIELNPKNSVYYNNRGNSYFELEQYQEAILDYSSSIELDSKDPMDYNNRGNSYFELEKDQEAILDYSRAIELDPKNADYYNNRGNSYFELEKYQEAILDYSRAIELDPKNADYYNNRGNSYFELEKDQEAILDYSRAIELDPKNADYYNNRGNSYFELEKDQEAILDYSCAIELDPKNADYYNNRGNSYFNLEKYQEAILDFSHAIEIDPCNIHFLNRGYAYIFCKEFEKSKGDIDKSLEIYKQKIISFYEKLMKMSECSSPYERKRSESDSYKQFDEIHQSMSDLVKTIVEKAHALNKEIEKEKVYLTLCLNKILILYQKHTKSNVEQIKKLKRTDKECITGSLIPEMYSKLQDVLIYERKHHESHSVPPSDVRRIDQKERVQSHSIQVPQTLEIRQANIALNAPAHSGLNGRLHTQIEKREPLNHIKYEADRRKEKPSKQVKSITQIGKRRSAHR